MVVAMGFWVNQISPKVDVLFWYLISKFSRKQKKSACLGLHSSTDNSLQSSFVAKNKRIKNKNKQEETIYRAYL